MVKSMECEDGSDAKLRQYPAASVRWRDLGAPVLRAADFGAPMKRSVRPFYSLLLLITFALTLSCRIFLRRHNGGGFHFSSTVSADNAIVPPPAPPVFNSTLLKYAAIEIGAEKAKQEIENLLEGKITNRGLNFATWRSSRAHGLRTNRTSRGTQIMLRSPQFYRYWLDFRRILQNWSRTKRFQPDIMNELVELIKHPMDNHNGFDASDKKYTSCAVVGNSGILLQQQFGSLIDSHEFVIRLNNARISKFDVYVGSKTNLSFVNSNILHLCSRRQGCYCHPYGANVPIAMYICQPLHLLDYVVCNSTHRSPLIVTDGRFDVLCSRIVKYYSLRRFGESGKGLEDWASAHDGSLFHYSSGFQAVMLAVGVCERVSLFGFGKVEGAKHHYHSNQKSELSLHDYEAEYEFYRDLVNNTRGIPFVSKGFEFPPVVIYR